MDIYSIINSKAISEYCRKIAHQFTPLEMAYLVYANDSMNIAQKHTAFNEIIEQYPEGLLTRLQIDRLSLLHCVAPAW